MLEELAPRVSSDGETVGLWGAIHKRLWEAAGAGDHLDEAINAYLRGFLLRNDHYNGINYAFLLDVRAARSEGEDAVADRVLAKRARGKVLEVCEARLKQRSSRQRAGEFTNAAEEQFWLQASRAETLLGLRRGKEAAAAYEKAKAMRPSPAPWMVQSMEEQRAKLEALLPHV